MIALRVFNLEPCDQYQHVMLGVAGHGWMKKCRHDAERCYPQERGPLLYSTRIETAWTVIDEMRRQDRYHGLCSALNDLLDVDRIEDMGWRLLELPGADVARVLCQAALIALDEPSVLDLGGAARLNAEIMEGRDAGEEAG